MSRGGEHKRVTLTSIFQGDAGFSRFGSNFLEPDAPPSVGAINSTKPPTKPAKCIRIKLDLFETDSNKYPEFNYSRLLYLEKKKAKKLKQVTTCNGADPFADNDDDVARIVKELEAKYGNSYATGRGKSKKDDYVDIGMGYDESDSFIDNTEAYDEIIPEEAETLEGGFYINCGALEFKNLTKKSYTTRTDAIIKMPERSRKRMISSSSESSSSSSDDDDDDENDDNNNGEEEDDSDSEDDSDEEDESDSEDDSESESLEDEDSAATAKSSSSKVNPLAKRPKVIVTGKSKPSSGPTAGGKKPPTKPITTSSSSNSPRPSTVEISDTEDGQVQIQPSSQLQALPQTQSQAQAQALKKVVKTTTVKDMLKAKRDNFLKSQSGTAAVKGVVNGELKCISTDVSSSDSSDIESATDQGRSDRSGQPGQENLRTADTALPISLDADILTAVNSFKEAVRSRDLCGKKFILDAKLTPLLLRVYEAVLCTDRNERNMVFSHIEYQLQLPKYYMLRKGKQVRAKEEKKKSTNMLEKLRRAVAVVMPKAIANYETELRTFAEQAAADVNSELPPKMPRKKFQWTSELRHLLYDVYQARWTSYAFLAKRKDSLEEFISLYLKEKVVDLWPTGWMRLDELNREISRYKNAKLKAKEKPKAPPASASPKPVAPALTPEQMPQASSYLKPVEEPRSRGNSDTDSATSASSNSLKRKLKEMPKQTSKPPKKKVAKQLPQQPQLQPHPHPQFQLAPAATAAVSVPANSNSNNNNNHLPHLDTLLSMPSTSAQAAALNAAAAAAASTVLDLASPSRKMDLNSSSNFYNLITAATLAASGNPSPHSSDGQAKVIVGARPSPHVINLDDYQCTSEILQTSKQLAATTTVITSTSKAAQTTPVGRESSSESDGVEIVGVFPASKLQKKALPKPKSKTQNRGRSSLGAVGQVNGSLGFSANNMYIYNSPRTLGPVYDLTDPHIMKTMSSLKEMEKQLIQAAFSPNSVKGATGGMGSSAPSTPSRQ
ncbi:yemanuclein [Drosophila biarmipes]|uniref:yemanuclein n=1 Tax=Drosophila biarmipes TaxID=125945 RepID=UPI0007E827B7|nr:yemanuclein [Drosophila biarmipes]